MLTPFESRIKERTRDLPHIAVLLLFGSRAQGKERPNSDLDIAILPTAEASDSTIRLQLLLNVIKALADLAPEGRVDAVFLDEAPVTLRQRIMEHGRMILCRDLSAWKKLRVATMKEYGDSEGFRKVYRRALKKRLLEGVSHG